MAVRWAASNAHFAPTGGDPWGRAPRVLDFVVSGLIIKNRFIKKLKLLLYI